MSDDEQPGMEHDQRFRDTLAEGEKNKVDADDDEAPRPEFQHDARFRDTEGESTADQDIITEPTSAA